MKLDYEKLHKKLAKKYNLTNHAIRAIRGFYGEGIDKNGAIKCFTDKLKKNRKQRKNKSIKKIKELLNEIKLVDNRTWKKIILEE